MFFFTEALNILEHYKDNLDSVDDYRIKVKNDYQENYFKSLQKGEGFNIMDALEKAFVAENLDKKEANKILFKSGLYYYISGGICLILGIRKSIFDLPIPESVETQVGICWLDLKEM